MLVQLLAIHQYFNVILWLFIILFITFIVFYIKFVGLVKSLYYKLYYILGFFVLLLLLLYNYLEILILYLFKDITDEIYVRDPYDVINVELVFVVFYVLVFLFIYFFYVIILFWLNIFPRYLYWTLIFNVILVCFYVVFCLWLVETDLFLSNWLTITAQMKFSYKVQLDLKMLIWGFFEEFWAIFNFLLYFWFGFFLECFIFIMCFIEIQKLYIWNIIRVILLGISAASLYQFFGGENLGRDFLLIILSILICELLLFFFLFLSKLKLKKEV